MPCWGALLPRVIRASIRCDFEQRSLLHRPSGCGGSQKCKVPIGTAIESQPAGPRNPPLAGVRVFSSGQLGDAVAEFLMGSAAIARADQNLSSAPGFEEVVRTRLPAGAKGIRTHGPTVNRTKCQGCTFAIARAPKLKAIRSS
jgi:hypothetical protein